MRLTGMLASVSHPDEALQMAGAGADIVDLKQPSAGALGALDIAQVAGIVELLAGRVPISATVGDLPMIPEVVRRAAAAMAATGVDYVKIGFFPGGDWNGTVSALADLAANGTQLVAVLFADTGPQLSIVDQLAEAGFCGAMLDTMDKSRGSLTEIYSAVEIRDFVETITAKEMLCGLAGSLKERDIGPLLSHRPDYLGFRGALCTGGKRTCSLDRAAVQRIRGAIPQATAVAASG